MGEDAPPREASTRCPTCGAEQVRSDTCRRCRSDLRLLHLAADESRRLRRRCLKELRRDRPRVAVAYSRALSALNLEPDTLRLAAVCELLAGDFARARAIALRLIASGRGRDLNTPDPALEPTRAPTLETIKAETKSETHE